MSRKAVASRKTGAENWDAIYPGRTQTIAIGASSVQASLAMAAGTTCVQLCATVACFVAVGSNPTAASTTSMYIPANFPVLMAVNPNDKIAAIQSTGPGSLYITEGA
jgi:hypothetical protein